MSDLINRQEVIDALDHVINNGAKNKYFDGHFITAEAMKEYILAQPSAQPERKKGKWIADVDRWGDVVTTVNGYICSECRVFNTDKDNYCPNCGCQMNGGEKDGNK